MKLLYKISACFALLIGCYVQSFAATQSSYTTKTTPVTSDKALITDSADGNKTKQATIGSLPISTATQSALDGKAGVSCFANAAAFNACFPLDWPTGFDVTANYTVTGAWDFSGATVIGISGGGGQGSVVLQQGFSSDSLLVADIGARTKLPAGVAFTTAEIGCDASDTLGVSVKIAATVNGTFTELGTFALTAAASTSGVDISSWATATAGHWIRIDLIGTPAVAKDCVIAIGGTEL